MLTSYICSDHWSHPHSTVNSEHTVATLEAMLDMGARCLFLHFPHLHVLFAFAWTFTFAFFWHVHFLSKNIQICFCCIFTCSAWTFTCSMGAPRLASPLDQTTFILLLAGSKWLPPGLRSYKFFLGYLYYIALSYHSYDYDAPVSEAGDLTEKWWAIREVVGR